MWLNLLLIFIAILFVIVLIIKRFVYFRPTYDFYSLNDDYENIYEGNLHAWYKKGSTGKVILFCHGNKGNLSHRHHKLVQLSKMGHSVLIFDYSGFGQSKGIPNEQLCYFNGDMFFNYLQRKGYITENIIPYGESMGGAIAAYISRKYNLPKLILESALPGIKYLIKSKYLFSNILGMIFNEFDTLSFVKGYKGRVLTLHCINDEVIPYNSVIQLKNISKFIDMDGSHNNPLIPWNEIEKFIGDK